MPKVAIIITGSELVEPGDNKNDDKIFNSNGPLLKSLFKEIKIEVNKYALVKDDPDILKSYINDFLNHSDILVITGGASVGKFDLSRKILEDLKFKKVFYKVAIKPGKPTYFYTYENKLIFGLPGNPLAVFTGFFLFIQPTLKYLLTNNFSLDTIKLKNYEIEVEGKVDPHRTNIIPAYIDFSQNKVKAKVIGSNQLLALTHSNCLLILEKQEAIMI
ncbi:MAG: molybdenum cofactor synthesis domain-containing protein [bacterium]